MWQTRRRSLLGRVQQRRAAQPRHAPLLEPHACVCACVSARARARIAGPNRLCSVRSFRVLAALVGLRDCAGLSGCAIRWCARLHTLPVELELLGAAWRVYADRVRSSAARVHEGTKYSRRYSFRPKVLAAQVRPGPRPDVRGCDQRPALPREGVRLYPPSLLVPGGGIRRARMLRATVSAHAHTSRRPCPFRNAGHPRVQHRMRGGAPHNTPLTTALAPDGAAA